MSPHYHCGLSIRLCGESIQCLAQVHCCKLPRPMHVWWHNAVCQERPGLTRQAAVGSFSIWLLYLFFPVFCFVVQDFCVASWKANTTRFQRFGALPTQQSAYASHLLLLVAMIQQDVMGHRVCCFRRCLVECFVHLETPRPCNSTKPIQSTGQVQVYFCEGPLSHQNSSVRMGKKEGMDTSNMAKKRCHDVWLKDKLDSKHLDKK